jgi:hypothetical protein
MYLPWRRPENRWDSAHHIDGRIIGTNAIMKYIAVQRDNEYSADYR